MKISLQWLKDYVCCLGSAQELAHRLTLAGLEVEKTLKVKGDTVFELEITPNRPDCLNYIGIAREASAIFDKSLKKPKVIKPVFENGKVNISIENKKDCSRYIGAILTGVKIAPSCSLLQKRLKTIGLRPINNIVDVTNFCLLETGQPMHAFDLDKLEGKKIIVRRARPGEKIVAINDIEYTLDASVLVIADACKPVAIAGIMGGKGAEVTDKTKNILLESAYFDPALIRRASRKLALRSDSSYRFERGVDWDMVEQGAWRAIALIQESAGGQKYAIKDIGHQKNKAVQKPIALSYKTVESFLGTAVSFPRIKKILTKLEFSVKQKSQNTFTVVPAGFRSDIRSDVDVIEEIARIIGYDRLAMRTPAIKAQNITTSSLWTFKKELARHLIGAGLSEAISYALVSAKAISDAGFSRWPVVCNQNPLTEDQQVLRPCLLPGLLQVISANLKKGQKNVRLFEIGKKYSAFGEKDTVAIIQTGHRPYDWRQAKPQKIDFYDIKGSVETLLQSLKIKDYQCLAQAHQSFASGQYAKIYLGKTEAGFLGKIHSDLLSRWEIKHQDVFYAQVDVAALTQAQTQRLSYQRLCDFPCATRDISLALAQEVSFQQVKDVIASCQEGLLQDVDLVEQYTGDQLPWGHRGLTISLTYQSYERTLTEDEVQAAHQNICHKIIADLKAVKR